jgi:N-acetylglucosamine-6-phosphate deacetylase
MGNSFTTFTNCRQCINGEIIEGERLVVSQDDGTILESTGYIGGEIVDLEDLIVAPGFLELHTNGLEGFHYSNFEAEEGYKSSIKNVAEAYPSRGITGFWATVPSIERGLYDKVSWAA